jgi:uncharacterized coiled-coil DUF342 family protein
MNDFYYNLLLTILSILGSVFLYMIKDFKKELCELKKSIQDLNEKMFKLIQKIENHEKEVLDLRKELSDCQKRCK